ncbi:MAG: hypothetical protein DI630_37545 [Gordonia sp. (in: high G+C Gram-positive bacteria)]|nr:MAG: hypothetical protein DI630_37545 [Gordonia sp. (in: high G+C Gram-positive bacteria)]
MIFCMPPMVRLTNTALREADPVAVEAVDSLGGTWWQTLKMVRLPLGVPTMLIGLNQAIMLALAMVVVSAFVGAPGLGATVLTALSRVDLAAGVNAGLCMLLLAVLADRVTGGLVRRLKVAEHLSSSPS